MKYELNNIYNEDCLQAMKQIPDKYFELAIIDPPYGVGTVTYMPRVRKKAFGGFIDTYEITMATIDINQRSNVKVNVVNSSNTKNTINNFGDTNINPCPEYFEQLFRISKNQIIFGGNYFLLPPSRGFAIWKKLTISESFSMAMCEYMWMSFNTNAKIFECAPQGGREKRFHPTQKPIKLYEWLLNNYANKGDKILDTHLGSASSIIACKKLGFEYMGFELDKEYFDLASERINKFDSQGNMFDILNEQSETEIKQTTLF